MHYNQQEISNIAAQLQANGFVTDDDSDLGSKAFEFPEKLIADLHQHGVQEKIIHGAHNRNNGAGSTFYWIALDTESEEAQQMAQDYADNHPDE